MALIYVHKIMIGTAVAFCSLFTARALWVGDVGLGLFVGAATIGLGLYFRWFLQTKADKVLGSNNLAGDDR